ncbi:MAG: helix-turn-helix domain-containing protein [Lachnospiraceae bacterium]|nr:helix-turn-helix domain-containing protein [Lachnospiraceae bacterium]
MSLVERIKKLAKEHGTDLANLERALGISNGVIRRWDKASPTCDKLLRVADYFSVSIDELLRGTSNTNNASNTNINRFITLFNNADSVDQERVIKYLELVCTLNTTSELFDDKTGQKNIISFKSIPVRGYVAAGTPIEAIDNDLNSIDIPSNLDVDYALIVSGNSMDPIIKDGEYVYVKYTNELSNNDIGVFYYNGNVTCKKLFKNEVMIKLISLNPTYEDFIFYLNDPKNETINFQIEGQVVLSEQQLKRVQHYYQLSH